MWICWSSPVSCSWCRYVSEYPPSSREISRYWDWVLDHQDPAASPVFDTQLGFGGNGDAALGESLIGGGHCVTDGPFAMTTARYIDTKVYPHCLSRNFRNDTSTGHFTGELIQPSLVKKILEQEDLLSFTLELEDAPHNTIPFGIRGDFLSFNAPAGKLLGQHFPFQSHLIFLDPLFFLHHAQLDRLWSKWQTSKPGRRGTYDSRRSEDSEDRASLTDVIEMGDLASEISVADIIDTEAGILCYNYDT